MNKDYQGPSHSKRPVLGRPCLRRLGVHGNLKVQMHISHDELIIEPYVATITITTIRVGALKTVNFPAIHASNYK